MKRTDAIAAAAFVSVMVAANLTVAHLGPWASPVIAFFFVGVSMVSRDVLHDSWHGRSDFVLRMGAMIGAAGLLAWAINPAAGRIAIASALALVASAAVETATFSRLIHRPWMVRSNGSNLPGSIVDTVVFTTVAFGVGWPIVAVMLAQGGMKVAGGFVWSLSLNPWRGRVAPAHQS